MANVLTGPLACFLKAGGFWWMPLSEGNKIGWPSCKARVRWGVLAGILVCQAEPETVCDRLKNRRGDASDADWTVYLQLATHWEEMGDLAGKARKPFRRRGAPSEPSRRRSWR